MEELHNKYNSCTLCKDSLHSIKVFGEGPINPRVCVVGEGPGNDEVEKRRPFIGEAGQLLDKILLGIGLKRENVYYTNSVLCRTSSKNRTPTKQECLNCRNRLFEELSIVKPKFTLLVGSPALRTVMGDQYKISESHGKWFTMLSQPCYFFYSCYHPAWILHSINDGEKKAKKITIWRDIKQFHYDMETMTESIPLILGDK